MDITDFQNKIVREILMGRNDDTDFWVSDTLHFYVANNGMLSCQFNGESIPCESEDWRESLDIIADFIKSKTQEDKQES